MPPGTGFFAAVFRHFRKPPGIRRYPGVSTLEPGSAPKRRCKNRLQTVRRNPQPRHNAGLLAAAGATPKLPAAGKREKRHNPIKKPAAAALRAAPLPPRKKQKAGEPAP